MKMVLGGQSYLSPLSQQKPPSDILDIATGTGLWAIEMGDEFPQARVIGTDLSPIQPFHVPPNVRFYVEDSYVCNLTDLCPKIMLIPCHRSEDWDYPQQFDFIHTRVTLGCWEDMKRQVVWQAFQNLRSGGWFEAQELLVMPQSDDGSLAADSALLKWINEINAASEAANRKLYVGDQIKHWLREIGFVDVQEHIFKIPVNGWMSDKQMKTVGMMWQRNLLAGLSGFSLGLLNRVGGRSVEDIEVGLVSPGLNVLFADDPAAVQVTLVDVRREITDQNIHAYQKLYVVCGRKP
jgi:hypothetical protein